MSTILLRLSCLIDLSWQIAGAIDSAWRTTGEVLGRGVAALGREYFSADQKRLGSKTDISFRRFKACVIPKHLNVPYVDMF